MKVLIAWLGREDLRAAQSGGGYGLGPLAEFLVVEPHERVVLLNAAGLTGARYPAWLAARTGAQVDLLEAPLARPHDFDAVYDVVRKAVAAARDMLGEGPTTYLVSSGTKAMSSALVLVGCVHRAGRIFHNWADTQEPDPARRCVELSWPAGFSRAHVAGQSLVGPLDGLLRDDRGREVTQDPAMQALYARASQVAAAGIPVLISGELGTGKSILGRFMVGSEAVVLDGAAVGPAAVEAATGAAMLVERVGALGIGAQQALGAVLERGGTRVVASCVGNLWELVTAGQFREDVYFQLTRYRLHLPPLRDRAGDVRLIGQRALDADALVRGGQTTVEPLAWRALAAHPWPGNVRELSNVMTRLLLDVDETNGKRVVDADLVARVLRDEPAGGGGVGAAGIEPGRALVAAVRQSGRRLQEVMERWEAAAIREAIHQERTQKDAGALLGYSPQNLSNTKRRLQKRGFWPAASAD